MTNSTPPKKTAEMLPRLMLVTDRKVMRPNFEDALETALQAGARLIQLREKDLSSDELASLAARAGVLCARHDAQLICNGDERVARNNGCGLHLGESQDWEVLQDATRPQLVGVSTHSVEAARRASTQCASYIVFGSVFASASHPGSSPSGIAALREVCAAVCVPVFAIGGINASNALSCLEAGAHGVAAIGAAWQLSTLSALLDSVSD